MAIYHLSGTVISRSQGRSAVAAAAYRSASKLHDHRQDITHDYTKKQDVAFTEILLPEGALEWMRDREALWNGVEAAEKRKDAQLAREFNLSLPKELSIEQNIALAKEFVQQQFVAKGMVADLAIHNDVSFAHHNVPSPHDDVSPSVHSTYSPHASGERQPHAHVMLTLREVTPDGFGQKVREWNAKENLLQWREAWAETVNRHLFLHGHDVTIDHRSLSAQGIELEPQHKIGPVAAQQRMARLADHQRIARENGDALLKKPSIALTAITRQQSTFTHQDLARFVNRHTVDAEQFQAVYGAIKTDKNLVALGTDAQGRERFTTQEMLQLEHAMITNAEQLAQRHPRRVNNTAKTKALTTRTLTDEQKMAFEHLVSDGDIKAVIGYAGSGKSYLLGAAREAWEATGHTVHGVTLSGIAAENLEAGSGIPSRTIASRFYYWNKGEQSLTANDILVVDEAGMVGSRQLGRLLEEVARARAKVVLVGDPCQLQAIEAGAAFRAIAERTPTVRLTEIRRQQHAWQRNATIELATGKTEAAIQQYAKHDHVHAFETQAMAKQGLIELWNDVRLNQPDKTQIILSYTRDDTKIFNELARTLRQQHHELGEDRTIMTARGERQFAEHDRIYFLENNRHLGVKNGTLGTIEAINGSNLTVQLDNKQREKGKTNQLPHRVTVNLNDYNHIDHGYAATIHKSQGVTVDRSYLLASKYLDSHATYVALSRHRDSADIFYGKDEFANERALTNTLRRERPKDITVDYTQPLTERADTNTHTHAHAHPHPSSTRPYTTFAEQRGFEKSAQASLSSPSFPSPLLYQMDNDSTELTKTVPTEKPTPLIDVPLDRNTAQQYEHWLRQSLKEAQQNEHTQLRELRNTTLSLSTDRDFSDFKRQFETESPEQAKALQEAMQTRHEKVAIEVEKHITALEKASKEANTSRTPYAYQIAQEKLGQYAADVTKQKDIMTHLQQKNPTLSDRIHGLSKSYERMRDRGMDIDR